MIARLFTTNGGFVTEMDIPFINTPPDVLVWGERFFRFEFLGDDDVARFIECFAWFAVP